MDFLEVENAALDQWRGAARTSRAGSGASTAGLIALAPYLADAAAAAGYDEQLAEALRRALDELCETWVERRCAGSVEVCVPARICAGDPQPMLALLRDPGSAGAFADVLASMPACDWAIESTVGL